MHTHFFFFCLSSRGPTPSLPLLSPLNIDFEPMATHHVRNKRALSLFLCACACVHVSGQRFSSQSHHSSDHQSSLKLHCDPNYPNVSVYTAPCAWPKKKKKMKLMFLASFFSLFLVASRFHHTSVEQQDRTLRHCLDSHNSLSVLHLFIRQYEPALVDPVSKIINSFILVITLVCSVPVLRFCSCCFSHFFFIYTFCSDFHRVHQRAHELLNIILL